MEDNWRTIIVCGIWAITIAYIAGLIIKDTVEVNLKEIEKGAKRNNQ